MSTLLHSLMALCIFPGGLFAIAFGLFLKALDRRLEARLQRRIGPPLMQPLYDLAKLCTKESTIPLTANKSVFLAAPVLALGGMLVCAALIPVPGVTQGLPSVGDLLLILYLLPLAAMALMLGASASSSPYGAIGLSREMLLMLSYELPLLVVLLTVALKTGMATDAGAEFSLPRIMEHQQIFGQFGLQPDMLPALVAWLFFLSAIMGVPPFDQAEAETEIIEGPLLEYSGPALAFFLLASAVKQVVVLGLGVVLFFPGTLPGGPLVNLLWFAGKCTLLMALALTLVKASHGRLYTRQAMRLFVRIPALLALVSLALVWAGI